MIITLIIRMLGMKPTNTWASWRLKPSKKSKG